MCYTLNLLSYIISLSILILILVIFKKDSTNYNNELSITLFINQIKFSLIISLLSLSGLPPLFGFFSKFFIVLFIASKAQWILLFLFSIFNLFSLYFYFQQLRYISQDNKKKEFKIILNNFYLNYNLLFIFSVFTFFICFGGFFLELITLLLSSFVV